MQNFRPDRSTLAKALAATVAGTALVGGAASAGSGGSGEPAAPRASAYSQQAKDATNDQRRRHDRRGLDGDRCLKRFAQRQAERMADRRTIYHQDLGPVLRRCDLRRAGENVAVGFPNGRSVVTDGWMESPGHRKNILRKGYREVAIGAVERRGTWYVAQVFGRD